MGDPRRNCICKAKGSQTRTRLLWDMNWSCDGVDYVAFVLTMCTCLRRENETYRERWLPQDPPPFRLKWKKNAHFLLNVSDYWSVPSCEWSCENLSRFCHCPSRNESHAAETEISGLHTRDAWCEGKHLQQSLSVRDKAKKNNKKTKKIPAVQKCCYLLSWSWKRFCFTTCDFVWCAKIEKDKRDYQIACVFLRNCRVPFLLSLPLGCITLEWCWWTTCVVLQIPLSGRNPQFMEALLVRPHILLLNKADVADARQKDRVKDIYREQGVSRVMYINCTGDASFVRKKVTVPRNTQWLSVQMRRFGEVGVWFPTIFLRWSTKEQGRSSLSLFSLSSFADRAPHLGCQSTW